MNLNYSQTTGIITDDSGTIIAKGWAGNGAGKNNPAMQDIHNVGPLPQGRYSIGGWFTHPRLGPLSSRLIQIDGETFGRDAFFFHGPSSKHYGQESEGCVVVPRADREKIAAFTPQLGNFLTVTA